VTGLIAGSILFIVLAAVCLGIGWLAESAGFIWLSIAGSVGSAACLALAYYRSRAEAAAPPPREAPRVRLKPPDDSPSARETALFDPESEMGPDDRPDV
jgi:hypothetical protein